MNGWLSLCRLAPAVCAALWMAACTPGSPRGEPAPAEPGAVTDPRSPAAPPAARSPPTAAQPAAEALPPPDRAVDESLITLLYTVNNMGFTGTCG